MIGSSAVVFLFCDILFVLIGLGVSDSKIEFRVVVGLEIVKIIWCDFKNFELARFVSLCFNLKYCFQLVVCCWVTPDSGQGNWVVLRLGVPRRYEFYL